MGKQDVRKGGSDASPSRFKPADNEKEKDSSEYEWRREDDDVEKSTKGVELSRNATGNRGKGGCPEFKVQTIWKKKLNDGSKKGNKFHKSHERNPEEGRERERMK